MEMRASGRTWAVATPHSLATEAAAVAFERGGNAIDAALSAAATLAVVYPHMCGVGGDLFALVHQPAGDVVAVNASGRAVAAADPAVGTAESGGHMPQHGPLSVTELAWRRHRLLEADQDRAELPCAGSGAVDRVLH